MFCSGAIVMAVEVVIFQARFFRTSQIKQYDHKPGDPSAMNYMPHWLRLACFTCFLSVAAFASEPGRTETNVPFEISFTSQRPPGDPLNEPTLDVVFTAPDKTVKTVPGFWAGGSTWKVRYASPITGLHRWRSVCGDTSDKGLHNIEGQLNVSAYRGANPLFKHGPLRATKDQRRFEHYDGTPFFWLGDTWWMGLSHRLHFPDDFKQLAADRKTKGFTVIQIVAGLYPDMHPFDPRGANEAGFPWEKEYARIRPEYFDAADARLRYLLDEGFTVCLVGAWGYFLPMMGEAKMKAHWRYLIARYASWPVVWVAAGEANLPWYLAKNFPTDDRSIVPGWTEMLRYIRSTDPFRRPLTIHPTAINRYNARHVTDDPALLDFDFLQTPHGQRGAVPVTVRAARESYAASPIMPTINGEAAYEMLGDKLPTEWTRAMFWLCMMNGAAGHTYGANGIWQVNRKNDPHGPSPTAKSPPTGYGVITWDEAMRLPGSQQMSYGKRFFESLPWTRLKPMGEHVAWADPPKDPKEDPLFTPQMVGVDQSLRVVYGLEPRAVTVRTLRSSTKYHLFYFDPVTGERRNGPSVAADAKGEARIDAAPYSHDWVAVLKR